MPTIYFPAAWQEEGYLEPVTVSAKTVGEALRAACDQYPTLTAHLFSEGRLAPAVSLSIDGEISPRNLVAEIEPHSEIHVIPLIGAG